MDEKIIVRIIICLMDFYNSPSFLVDIIATHVLPIVPEHEHMKIHEHMKLFLDFFTNA